MASDASPGPEILIVGDTAAWRAWLDANESSSDGVWLLLAKKGTTSPTSLSYAHALDEALCSGWIDGQKKRHDDACFVQRFTPRRARSMWSQRNIEHVARLGEQERIRPRGEEEIARARADGRWDRAYAGSATATVPDDLAAALGEHPAAAARFAALSAQARYPLLLQLMTATSESVRARRLDKIVATLRDTTDTPGS